MSTCMTTSAYKCSFDSSCRFIQYNPTSLERNHKHELQTEVDLGVPIDLILPEAYTGTDSGGESRNRVLLSTLILCTDLQL